MAKKKQAEQEDPDKIIKRMKDEARTSLPEEYEDLTPEQKASLPPVKDPTENVPMFPAATTPTTPTFASETLMEVIQAFSPEGGETPEEALAKTREYYAAREKQRETEGALEDKARKESDDLEEYGTRLGEHRRDGISEALIKLHKKGYLTLSPELLRDVRQYLRAEGKALSRSPGVGYRKTTSPYLYEEEFGIPVKRSRAGIPEAPGKE